MNIVFLGTPAFAVEPLRQILQSKHRILAVVSQPDRETDKKGNLKPTAVKDFALSNGLKVLQYDKVCIDGLAEIRTLQPDVMVTAAFGQILSDEFLSIAPVFNVHASLLPRYRGSSPIQAAILNGDTETGVTIMKTVRAMDAGDILLQARVTIGDNEPYYELHDRLSHLGAGLLVSALDRFALGELTSTAQSHELATYTKKITKADGLIDWSKSEQILANCVRAYNPWPSAYTTYAGQTIKIFGAKPLKTGSMSDITHNLIQNIEPSNPECGEIVACDSKHGLVVRCGTGYLQITSLQAPGKRVLEAAEFLRGYRLQVGTRFTKG